MHVGSRALRAFLLGVFKLGTYWTCYTWLPGESASCYSIEIYVDHICSSTTDQPRRLPGEGDAPGRGQEFDVGAHSAERAAAGTQPCCRSHIPTFIHQHTRQSLSHITTTNLPLQGMLCFGHVSDRIGRRPAVSMYSALTAAAVAGLAYQWEVLSRNKGLFWLDMFCLGLGSGLTAVFGSLLAELFPTQIRGVMMGAVYNCARAVQLLSPVAVEAALEWKGLAGAWLDGWLGGWVGDGWE